MTSRKLVTVQLAENSSVSLPAVFTAPIRPDVVQFVHTNIAKNKRQAYAVKAIAGHDVSAHSWGTGRAVARIPRVSGGGTHRAGQGAFGNMCRGGRMFAPTKTWRKWHRKVNVNQRRYAVVSALAASAVPALVQARGHKIQSINEVPLVVDDSAFTSISKTKDAVTLLKSLNAYADVDKVKRSRKIRSGQGKLRNRRYTQRRGPLLIVKDKNAYTKAFRNLPGLELAEVSRLNLLRLAPGGHVGRFVIWTKSAFEELDNVYGSTKGGSNKTGFTLPHGKMSNADITRIINSDEVQSVVRPKREAPKRRPHRANPLKNLGARVKLNPHYQTHLRRQLLKNEAGEKRKAEGTKAAGGKKKKTIRNKAFAEQLLQ